VLLRLQGYADLKHGAHEPQLAAEVRALGHVLGHQVGMIHPEQHVDRSCLLHNCTHVQLVGNSSRNEYSKTRCTVINPPSVTGKNLGTVVKKICKHHAGMEIRQTGISCQSGSSTYTVQFSILTENSLLLE
jgi:hypothetical protein